MIQMIGRLGSLMDLAWHQMAVRIHRILDAIVVELIMCLRMVIPSGIASHKLCCVAYPAQVQLGCTTAIILLLVARF